MDFENHNDTFIIQENRGRRLNPVTRGLWVEDVYLASGKRGAMAEEGLENSFLGKTVSPGRLFLVFFIAIFILCLLWARVFYLQVIKGDYYAGMAEDNRIRHHIISPLRGIIYDRYGRQLVENVPSFSLYLTPADLPKKKEERLKIYEGIYNRLSQIEIHGFGETLGDFINRLEDKIQDLLYISHQPVLILENLEYEQALILKIAAQTVPGMVIETESQRDYLIDDEKQTTVSVSHLLGYLGRLSMDDAADVSSGAYTSNDFIGKNGVELYYEDKLRGRLGRETIEVNAIGKPTQTLSREEPVNGENLMLTLDYELQNAAESILQRHLDKRHLSKGVVVILDPSDGEILALVSLPAYNVNVFSRGISITDYRELVSDPNHPLFFRAISGEYPSGSTFKPIVAAAALQEGVVNFDTLVYSRGGIRIGQWFFPDWKAGGHGLVNVTRAIAESVNTFFYTIGGGWEKFDGLGVSRITRYAREFGLGGKLAVDLPGERGGFLPSPEWKESVKKEQWYIGDTYHLAIGQGDILVTPLQVAAYTAVFANNGTLYRPHLLFKIISSKTADQQVPPSILRQDIISQKNLNVVRLGMRKAVTSGSARSLNRSPLAIAGKTGTAQWGSQKKPHAWFTSFAPFERPKIVVTVLVEEGGEGSETAVPIAEEIYYWYWKNRMQ
ncbi:MAG: penicillin-binding protein 2 [Parcubacteria group bacterium]|nr:penicillin-binding protein 2 [Parcubacteria group bacterium]